MTQCIATRTEPGKRPLIDVVIPVLNEAHVLEKSVTTVRAFVATAEADDAVGEVINIGSNFEVSIGDTARLIAEVMNVQVSVELDAGRLRPKASEVGRLLADNSKAKRLLGWEPAYAGREGLRRGLEETVAWFKDEKNLRLYRPGEYSV
jgi:dTDP-glucose 4,6-dehydratase